jgi:hypothetical protein
MGSALWSAKIPSGGFQRNVTLLHSDRLPSEALCCAKIPSYFEALTDPRDKPILSARKTSGVLDLGAALQFGIRIETARKPTTQSLLLSVPAMVR